MDDAVMDEISSNGYFQTRFQHESEKGGVWKAIIEYLDKRIDWGDTVVDAGAGYGYAIAEVDAPNRHAVDRNTHPLSVVPESVHTSQADVRELPFADNSVDSLMLSNVLEHLTRDGIEDALAEGNRVLVPDGTLIVIQPNIALAGAEYWNDYTHITPITLPALRDWIVASGFDIRHTEHRFLPFSAEGRIPPSYWLTKSYLALPWRPIAGQSLVIAQ